MNRIRSVLAVVAALLAARRHVHEWDFTHCRPAKCTSCGKSPQPIDLAPRATLVRRLLG